MVHESWRPVTGFEGVYEVSDFGRFRNARGRILKPSPINSGYLSLHLYPGNGVPRVVKLAHRLVAEAFVKNPFGLPEVNHEDTNKHNNAASNLVWSTRQGNVDHALAAGRFDNRDIKHAVIGVSIADGTEIAFNSKKEAEIELSGTGKQSSAIYHCLSGKKKSAYGFVWRRA